MDSSRWRMTGGFLFALLPEVGLELCGIAPLKAAGLPDSCSGGTPSGTCLRARFAMSVLRVASMALERAPSRRLIRNRRLSLCTLRS